MPNPFQWTIEKIKQVNELIWRSPKNHSHWESVLYRQLRIIILAARGFNNDKVQLRASALTFYSLLSMVPIVAIAFAIAKGFGLEQSLQQAIIDNAQFQTEVTNWLLSNATSALENTRGGYIAGIGIVVLFWSVLSLLENIESSFNHIWQVRVGRPWYRKFTDYLTFLLIAPIFIILSSSITVFISQGLNEFMSTAKILSYFKPLVTFLIQFAPYILFWISMTILFIVMPNTTVRFKPAIISGIIAGTTLHLLQWLYFELQFGITKLNAIYGSFAAVPLFIVWMQSSWIIVLIGAELTYANQNIDRYELEFQSVRVSFFQRRALILMILQRVIEPFSTGDSPLSAEEISSGLSLPVRLVRDILQDLQHGGLVTVIHEEGAVERFQPALDINKMSVSFVLSKMDRKGSSEITISGNDQYGRVTAILEKFEKLGANSDGNILIKDL